MQAVVHGCYTVNMRNTEWSGLQLSKFVYSMDSVTIEDRLDYVVVGACMRESLDRLRYQHA